MCRLVAYAGPSLPVRAPLFEGVHSLYRQSWEPRELRSGSVNADGWGAAWWTGSRREPLRIARAEPIWYDPEVESLLSGVRGEVIQATLRNATPGLPVDRAGLLPLVRDDWSFSLNGWIPEFRAKHMRALRAPLTDERYARLEGASDAETMFLRLLDALDAGSAPVPAMRALVAEIDGRVAGAAESALTLVLASADGVYTLHTSAGGSIHNSLYLATRVPWAVGGSMLASEPLDPHVEWTAVPPGNAVVQHRDGRVELSR